MTENIDSFQKEVESYLKNENFNIFVSKKNLELKSISQIFWDDDQKWKDFFSIAKNDGISTIIEVVEIFTEEELDYFKESLDKDGISYELENIQTKFIKNLEKNIGSIGTIEFFWIKDNVKYLLSKKSEWAVELDKQLLLMETQKEEDELEEDNSEIISALLEKDPNDLAKELMEWMDKEYPGATVREMQSAKREFFDSIGFDHLDLDKARNLREKVSSIVYRIIEEKEKEKMPELIEDCVKWSEGNNLKKLTKAHIVAFLDEKKYSLSGDNYDILYTRVNFKLKSK